MTSLVREGLEDRFGEGGDYNQRWAVGLPSRGISPLESAQFPEAIFHLSKFLGAKLQRGRGRRLTVLRFVEDARSVKIERVRASLFHFLEVLRESIVH